ncbi:MAG: lipopolysaccharide biosynthesis protein [Desulfobulbaceae bacterium]|nr:lipopolysaccharide biosynthesis protein [Desulfobulbaceae bacterium]
MNQTGSGLFGNIISRKGIISLSDQVVASGTNFLTGAIIGRTCAKEEFGYYMLCLSVVLFFIDLQSSLISAPYMVFSQRYSGREHRAYSGSTLLHQITLLCCLVLLLAGATAVYSTQGKDVGLIPVLWVLVLVVFFILLRDYIRKLCFASLMMRSAFVVDCCVSLFQITLLLLLADISLLSATTSYLAIGYACATASVGWLYFNRQSFSFSRERIKEDFLRNWSFGKWIFASGLLWALSLNLYPWLLAYFHGAAAAAVWGACFGIAAIGNPLLLGIQNFLGPKIIRAHATGGKELLGRFVISSAILFSLIIMPFCLILMLFGDQLVILVYGVKYGGHGLVISILALNLLVSAASFTLSRVFYAVERVDLFFVANFVPVIMLLFCGILLVKMFGPLGVAYGILLSSTAISVVLAAMYYKFIRST